MDSFPKIDEPAFPTPPPYFITVSTLNPATPLSKFVNYEVDLHRSPGLTTCHYCQVQVTTNVTYCIGTYAWLMCLVFVACG
ncbi:hypothetical protein N1851_016057 [Merluccius polli]|uniref:LITAF domain-containing protein n=1 Tax=Merluccius polli TaxID=89951 RepID=A0AA47P1K5_MERPO|nr:hypothetical protein N1851_016057 [Merluccius polli]